MKRRFILAAAASMTMAGGSLALADYDVSPGLSGGQIVTSAYDDGTGSFVSNVRVFDYMFDEPYDTEDPGFHPRPGSGLTSANDLHVGAVTGLSYWNGIGSPSFTALPNSETLNLAYGLSSITIASSAPAGTLDLGSPSDTGEFDHHLESTLSGPASSDPTGGLYLVSLQLSSDGLTSSQPFYVIYNTGDDQGLSDEAVRYVRDAFAPGSSLVPEPASLSLIGLPMVFGLVRRRRN
jgi:hypothetical protein